MSHFEERFMYRAIELSRKAGIVEKTGGVFGAVIVKDREIVGEGYNQVLKTCDPTWHAEMQAIREASQKLQTPHLEGCVLYTSAECCPMCLAASYWAHIDKIFYASTTADALQYGEFDDIDILEEIKKPSAERKITAKEMMRSEATQVWQEFYRMPDRGWY